MTDLSELEISYSREVWRLAIETQHTYRRRLLQALGWICVGLGAIGVVLPVMPTTVFLLIALWAFARSSPSLHAWLLNNPHFGPYITDWENHRVIPVRAKTIALTMMTASALWLIFGANISLYVVLGIIAVMIVAAAFILTRPSHQKKL